MDNHSLDPSKLNKDLLTALKTETQESDRQLEAIKVAIQSGAHVNARDTFGNTVLMLAVEQGKLNIVSYLLTVPGINLSLKNKFGETAIMHAAVQGDAKIAEILVTYSNSKGGEGLDINAAVELKFTALMKATGMGHDSVALELLKVRGILINPKNDFNGSALSLAISSKCTEAAVALLKHDDIEIDNLGFMHYENALTLAALNENLEVIHALVIHPKIHTIVNKPAGREKETALMRLVRAGNLEGVTALLTIPGIDVFYGNPLSGAQKNHYPQIEALLNAKCASVVKQQATENKSQHVSLPQKAKPTRVVFFRKDPKLILPKEYEKILARGVKEIALDPFKQNTKKLKPFDPTLEPKSKQKTALNTRKRNRP